MSHMLAILIPFILLATFVVFAKNIKNELS